MVNDNTRDKSIVDGRRPRMFGPSFVIDLSTDKPRAGKSFIVEELVASLTERKPPVTTD